MGGVTVVQMLAAILQPKFLSEKGTLAFTPLLQNVAKTKAQMSDIPVGVYHVAQVGWRKKALQYEILGPLWWTEPLHQQLYKGIFIVT